MALKKLMIVDDEKNLRELLTALFEDVFDVKTVATGQECLETLKTYTPDLILMDMFMPGMSGREATEKIRKNPKTKKIPVIFVTVSKFSETGKEMLKSMDVKDYITKPFDNEDLVRRVKKAIK